MFDMMKMMGKIKEVQAKVKEAQDNLVNLKVSGESGAGLVRATANGQRQVLSIEIDPSLINKEDQQVMQDLVVAAVNNALSKAEEAGKEEIKKQTEGILPNIPGFDLGNMV